jgi:hypothetical protein
VITENRRAALELRERALKRVAAVKNVVAENQRHVVLADETSAMRNACAMPAGLACSR